MKKTVISYLKYSAAGLIASAADNLTYFLLNRFGLTDIPSLITARRDSFPRYLLLVMFSTTIVYFLMKWLKPLIPINPTFIKMGIEFAMNFFNYAAARFFVFEDKRAKKESFREA